MAIDLSDIYSLSEFQRNTRDHISKLKATGNPAVLTVNGQAEVVVQKRRSLSEASRRPGNPGNHSQHLTWARTG
jgi:hypothetical protein